MFLQTQNLSTQYVKTLSIKSVSPVQNPVYNLISFNAAVSTVTCEIMTVLTKVITVCGDVMRFGLVDLHDCSEEPEPPSYF